MKHKLMLIGHAESVLHSSEYIHYPLYIILRDICKSFCYEADIFSIHFQMLYASWTVLARLFFKKTL
jgi:hypothetical protein